MRAFPLEEDIELVQELLKLDSRTLSSELGVSRMTLNRWSKEPERASREKLEAFYGYAFKRGIRLNEIHAQLFVEETRERGLTPLFHGSKRGIEGPLSLSESRSDNDFGQGLYCGESFSQSAMFVARYPNSVCYFTALDEHGLSKRAFLVDNDWMLAVALFRGKLSDQSRHDVLMRIGDSVACADLVVAPIADNRMFEIIDSFIDGEITDEQCKHSLSATGLGLQYVLRTDAALQGIVSFQPHYLCEAEKAAYLQDQGKRMVVRTDKAKAAKRKYRAVGHYIEELLQ